MKRFVLFTLACLAAAAAGGAFSDLCRGYGPDAQVQEGQSPGRQCEQSCSRRSSAGRLVAVARARTAMAFLGKRLLQHGPKRAAAGLARKGLGRDIRRWRCRGQGLYPRQPDGQNVAHAAEVKDGSILEWTTPIGKGEDTELHADRRRRPRLSALRPGGRPGLLPGRHRQAGLGEELCQGLRRQDDVGLGLSANRRWSMATCSICTPGGSRAMLVALNKKTGETSGKTRCPKSSDRKGQDGAGYASVVIGNGRRSEAVHHAHRPWRRSASTPKTGKLLWHYNRVANGTANIPTPIVKGDLRLLLQRLRRWWHGPAQDQQARQRAQRRGSVFLAANKTAEPSRRHDPDRRLRLHGSRPQQGLPVCVELKTGKACGVRPRPGNGSAAIAYADGHLYFRYQDGTMALIEATPRRTSSKGQFKIATPTAKLASPGHRRRQALPARPGRAAVLRRQEEAVRRWMIVPKPCLGTQDPRCGRSPTELPAPTARPRGRGG